VLSVDLSGISYRWVREGGGRVNARSKVSRETNGKRASRGSRCLPTNARGGNVERSYLERGVSDSLLGPRAGWGEWREHA